MKLSVTGERFSEGDPLGLSAWSAAHGLSPARGLLLLTAFLTGLAANSAGISRSNGRTPVPPVTVIGSMEDTPLNAALASITGLLLKRQAALVAKALEYRPDEIAEAFFPGGPWASGSDELKALGVVANAGDGSDRTSEAYLDRDSQLSQRLIRLHNLVRVLVILTGLLPENIGLAAEKYHRGMILAGGASLGLPQSRAKRLRRVDDLLAITEGIQVSSQLTSRSPMISTTVELCGILRAPAADLDWIAKERGDFFSRVIPTVEETKFHDPGQVDFEAADKFQSVVDQIVTLLLARRRAFVPVPLSFSDNASANELRALQLAFQREVNAVPLKSRISSVATLPTAMAWTLLAVGGRQVEDQYILQTALESSREIHRSASWMLNLVQHSTAAEAALKLARSLEARLRRVGPNKRRELVRGFNRQNLDIYEPAFRCLIDAGVFSESENGTLSLGNVPISTLSISDLSTIPRIP